MNKTFTLRTATVLMAAALSCNASWAVEPLVKAKVLKGNTVTVNGKKLPRKSAATVNGIQSAVQLKSITPRKAWSDGSTEADILLDEDFSAMTAGTVNKPDTKLIASYYYQPGMYIDSSLTKDGTWAGNNVYQAGGAVALLSPNEYTGSTLFTPLGDYSGDLTITFKVKALVNADLFVNVCKGGYSACDDADVRGSDNTYDLRLYASQGWKEVTLKVSNYSADNDGFIQFQNYGSVVIDDVKITTTSHFIATPKTLPETNFTGTSFTANWQPVRKAFDYRLNLYKKVYKSDKDAEYNLTFEDGNAQPNGVVATPVSDVYVKEGVGNNDSKGIVMCGNDTLTMPYNFSKYKTLDLWTRFYVPDPDNTSDWYETALEVQVRQLDGSWASVANVSIQNFLDGRSFSLSKYVGNEQFYGVRFISSGVPEGCYIALDDIKIKAGRDAELEEVFDPDFSVNAPGYDVYYDKTKNTTYTFENLDPYADYYYSLRTHYLFQYSEPSLTHAIGVATPKTAPATDVVDGESYAANWLESPRATSYEVSNYGVTNVKEDTKNYVLLNEDFSAIDSDVTESTDPYAPEDLGTEGVMSLDGYTKLPGWTTTGTTVAQGMVGCASTVYTGGTNYIKTPTLYLGNNSKIYMHVKAYGPANEGLVMYVGGKVTGAYFKSTGEKYDGDGDNEKGVIDGTFEFNTPNALDNVTFYTLEHNDFTLDEVTIYQDLKAGDKTYTYLDTKATDGKTLTYTFADIAQYGTYDDYAFNVKALLSTEGESAESKVSDFRLVSDKTPVSTGVKSAVATGANAVEVARYTVDGKLIVAPVKGVNLVKMSDGTTRKVVVK